MEKKNYMDIMSKLQIQEDELKMKINEIDTKKREIASAYAKTIEDSFTVNYGQKVRLIYERHDENGKQRFVDGFYSGIHFNGSFKFFPTLYKIKKDGTLSKNLYMNCDIPDMSEIVKVEDVFGNVCYERAINY